MARRLFGKGFRNKQTQAPWSKPLSFPSSTSTQTLQLEFFSFPDIALCSECSPDHGLWLLYPNALSPRSTSPSLTNLALRQHLPQRNNTTRNHATTNAPNPAPFPPSHQHPPQSSSTHASPTHKSPTSPSNVPSPSSHSRTHPTESSTSITPRFGISSHRLRKRIYIMG